MLSNVELQCESFEYYEELKGKLKQSDIDNLQPNIKTLEGNDEVSDFIEIIEDKFIGESICYKGVLKSYATEEEKESLPLGISVENDGSYIGGKVDCSDMTLSRENMFNINI